MTTILFILFVYFVFGAIVGIFASIGFGRMYGLMINKKGIVLPRDFVKEFGHLRAAECVYEGNFNAQFRRDVMDGKYPVFEGVVAKGVLASSGNPQHGLWMSKVKTRAWVGELRRRVAESKDAKMAAAFASVLADTEKEQEKNEENDLTPPVQVISSSHQGETIP
jgi:hypothetical protein